MLNSKKNLEAEAKAEKEASQKIKEARLEIEKYFVEAKKEVVVRSQSEKDKLELEKNESIKQLSGSIGSEIAKHLGADYVEE